MHAALTANVPRYGLAHSACLPHGIILCCCFFFIYLCIFSASTSRQLISESTRLIFTKFSGLIGPMGGVD